MGPRRGELLNTHALVVDQPERLALRDLRLRDPEDEDVVVDVRWTGVSTGTERLLWTGRMPPFPGMGYPLVPGYEAVGRVARAGPGSGRTEGQWVFVPGARCYPDARGLFGASASRLVVEGGRTTPIDESLADRACLLALTATAVHAVVGGDPPDLVVGHGALGRLLARVALALEAPAPTVWETRATRRAGADGYPVVHPDEDQDGRYASIYDVSGDAGLLDTLVGRLERGGEVVLAGFYSDRLDFAFPPAFLKEARFRIAAEWAPPDLARAVELVQDGRLSLDGIITHRAPASTAVAAYETAFTDPECVKLVLDWGTDTRDSHRRTLP